MRSAAATSPPAIVTPAEARRFDKAATITDRSAFMRELERLVRRKLAADRQTGRPAAGHAAGAEAANDTAAAQPNTTALQQQTQALRAATAWQPDAAGIQSGREALLAEFNQAHNLPLADFARLAAKSRQQVYKDIAAGRLLALNIGRRGQRLPDWQLDAGTQALTQAVLAAARPGDGAHIDNWTIYHALCSPLDALGGAAPVQALRRGRSAAAVTRAVLAILGWQAAGPGVGGAG